MKSKITPDSREIKEAADIFQQVKAHPNPVANLKAEREEEPNLRSEKTLPNIGFDNVRFQRGSLIIDRKNQTQKLDKFHYRVKSQSTCGEYEVLSTELGSWICSCADHKFRGVICKHIWATVLNREQEAEACNQNVIE